MSEQITVIYTKHRCAFKVSLKKVEKSDFFKEKNREFDILGLI